MRTARPCASIRGVTLPERPGRFRARRRDDEPARSKQAPDPHAAVRRRRATGRSTAREPDWESIGHVEPPDGAPNVLLVLIDDAGFGNPGTFGGPIDTPNYTRMADEGLRYNRFHVTALCSPTRAALLTGRNSHAVGFGSVGEFSTGFPGYTAFVPDDCVPFPRILRDNGYSTAAFGKWHLTPDGQQGPAGPVQPLARRLGVRLLLRLPRRGLGPVGPVPGREPEDHRHPRGLLRRGREDPYYLPDDMADKTIEWLHAIRAQDAEEAVLHLLLDRLQPRAAPRVRGMGREVQGQVRPGLGQAARGDLRQAEGARASSLRTRS